MKAGAGTERNVLIFFVLFPAGTPWNTHFSDSSSLKNKAPRPHNVGRDPEQKSQQFLSLAHCFWSVEMQNSGAKIFSFGFLCRKNNHANAKTLCEPAWIVLRSGSVLAVREHFGQRVVEKFKPFYHFWPWCWQRARGDSPDKPNMQTNVSHWKQ